MICDHDLSEMETAVADGMCPKCLSATVSRQDAVIERLRAALKPFAEAAKSHGPQLLGDATKVTISLGACRRAKTALNGGGEQNAPERDK